MASRKAKKVIVYSTQWCPWCKRVKDFLAENKVKFEERDIEKNPSWAKELVEKSGQTGIPVLDIGGKIIPGFDEKEIREALGI